MSVLKWIVALVASTVLYGIANFLQQIFIDYLFEHANYWVASIISVIVVILVINWVCQRAFFIIPYITLKLTSVSLYYFSLFCFVLNIFMAIVRTDFYLDNSTPKWVHIMIYFLSFVITYGQKEYVYKVASINKALQDH
jgi:hypothetical protein